MTGKEHYEEAERLLKQAAGPMLEPHEYQTLITAAHAHAALAQVQAQLAIATGGTTGPTADAIWYGWGEQ